MADITSPEEAWEIIDDAIARKKAIADGESAAPFTTEENLRVYTCVYHLCNYKWKTSCKDQVYEKYTHILEERIMEKAIPKLLGKHGASLLTEVTKSWSDFKAFADSIFKFFLPLDRFCNRSFLDKVLPELVDTPRLWFCKLVCERLYGKIQEAAMNLVIQDREGKEIDRNILYSVFKFFLDLGEKGTTNYYAKFEQVLLAETSVYYSELSMEWWFWRDSYANYLRKVDWCLVQEEARADVYPCESTKEKLLMVMKYILLERNAKRWTQKLKADGVRAEDEELVRKYDSLSLNGDFFASAVLGSE
ncbi:cullin-1-like [Euphorbia lathyris]|uniref:cullin-1-like n=1 Tax=Euphorbia lathyris TaxID=212925 RepID=UPI003313511C